jgi:hypothetical protein
MHHSLATTAWQSSAVIDLAVLNTPLLVGRDQGEQCRRQFGLAAQDVIFDQVEVRIPESTYSMSSSFFLGMFGPSIKAAGTVENFFSKYQFTTSTLLRSVIEPCVSRVLLERRFFG